MNGKCMANECNGLYSHIVTAEISFNFNYLFYWLWYDFSLWLTIVIVLQCVFKIDLKYWQIIHQQLNKNMIL